MKPQVIPMQENFRHRHTPQVPVLVPGSWLESGPANTLQALSVAQFSSLAHSRTPTIFILAHIFCLNAISQPHHCDGTLPPDQRSAGPPAPPSPGAVPGDGVGLVQPRGPPAGVLPGGGGGGGLRRPARRPRRLPHPGLCLSPWGGAPAGGLHFSQPEFALRWLCPCPCRLCRRNGPQNWSWPGLVPNGAPPFTLPCNVICVLRPLKCSIGLLGPRSAGEK